MEESQNQMENKFRLDTLTTIFAVLQIIFIILLIVSISRLFRSDVIDDNDPSRIPAATINNFDSVAPEGYSGSIDQIERTLFDLIIRNSQNKNASKDVDVFIREDSVKSVYFGNKNVNYFSAIVDVPDLRQSYWFYNEYSNTMNNKYIDYSKTYRIFCLDDSQEIIYQDFDCQDDFGIKGRLELVSDLITYFEFNYFSASYPIADDSGLIRIYPHSFNIDDEAKQSYIQQTKDAVGSLGVFPGLFTYRVMGLEDIEYYYP